MNRLQQLITQRLGEGKSYRDISKESGVNHVSITHYHNKGTVPDSKNLAMLAKYFRVEFYELLEEQKGNQQETAALVSPVVVEAMKDSGFADLPNDEKVARIYGMMRQLADKQE